MRSPFSFTTANYVARNLGYHMDKGWAQGETATIEAFRPLETFAERFDELLSDIKGLGYSAIDLWAAHLHWSWATLEHVAIARDALERHEITVRSYGAWVPGGAADLRGACRLCNQLGARYIAGFVAMAEEASSRDEAIDILREHAVGYAIENHPETSLAEFLGRMGDGGEDVIGLALDTGWCVTRGWDALSVVTQAYDRIFTVHLKDVKAPRPDKTGLEFIDMGHETCALGAGIAPIKDLITALRERGFRGPMGIEHEPEEFDPTEDIRESLIQAQAWWDEAEPKPAAEPLRVVVVGCGNIAEGYGDALKSRPEIEILGASDIDVSRAEAWTAKYGGRAYASLTEALADERVEAVVNLTIQKAHVEVVTQALNAGKHVHSEKPLAPTYAEAASLVELAREKNLRLSCAPATWLGEAQQTAWKQVREGCVGPPRVVYAEVDWDRVEVWHPNPSPFYATGPVADVGVYPMTLLTAWFGPVVKVTADGAILKSERQNLSGEAFAVEAADWAVGVLQFASGIRARLTADFYVGDQSYRRAGLEIHGDAGSLRTEWFAATSKVEVAAMDGKYRPVAPLRPADGEGRWYCDWSAGVVGLWHGLRTGEPHPTDGAQAAHVVEIIEGMQRSMQDGVAVALESTFTPPVPMPWAK